MFARLSIVYALMHSHVLTALVLTALLLAPAGAGADARRPVTDADAFRAEFEARLSHLLVDLAIVPSIGVAVVVDDEIVIADAWGMADLDSKTPATGETVYYIASSTKPFTGLMAAVLDSRGVLT
ncbi:MAG: serine hydrolase, partial [Gemmatimonadetes bacterium]|nr:serine hydrolase [Gemmatimonadota bacterium]